MADDEDDIRDDKRLIGEYDPTPAEQQSSRLLAIVLRSADADTAAALSGMSQSGGYLLASLGPLVMGLLHSATDGWTVPLLFLLLVAVVIWVPAMTAAQNRVIRGV